MRPEWPHCLTEAETLRHLIDGGSIARLGDGEFAIALGGRNSTHARNPRLAEELRQILLDPAPGCLPAIPTMEPASPKFTNWVRHRNRFRALLDLDRTYGSAFVGQIGSAPWIAADDHINGFRSVWRGKRVVAISPGGDDPTRLRVWHGTELVMVNVGGDAALEKMLTHDAAEVLPLRCPGEEAYAKIDAIEGECVRLKPDTVVICAGPMATVLANRLARHGIQGIDLGRGLGTIIRNWPT